MRAGSAAFAVALIAAASADAGDGVREINQACAQSGCFTGDTAGMPVQISVSGSYRLTGNLQANPSTGRAFQISADDVVLDLAGFQVVGTGNPAHAVPLISSTGERVALRNGTVRSSGDRGIVLGAASTLERIETSLNLATGIDVGANSLVSDCRADRNFSHGIVAAGGARIEGSAARFNSGTGIVVYGAGGSVSGSTSIGNGGDGIGRAGLEGGAVLVRANVAQGNGGVGINAAGPPDETHALIVDNSVIDNGAQGILGSGLVRGNTVSSNGTNVPVVHSGIVCLDSCNVRENVVAENAGFGIEFAAAPTRGAYSHNTVTGNVTGTVTGGVNRGDNLCQCNPPQVCAATCP